MRVTNVPAMKLWKTPRFKAFEPSGVTLGAEVTFAHVAGQVWSKAPGGRMWWVVTSWGAEAVHESAMTVVGQCSEPAPVLFNAA